MPGIDPHIGGKLLHSPMSETIWPLMAKSSLNRILIGAWEQKPTKAKAQVLSRCWHVLGKRLLPGASERAKCCVSMAWPQKGLSSQCCSSAHYEAASYLGWVGDEHHLRHCLCLVRCDDVG